MPPLHVAGETKRTEESTKSIERQKFLDENQYSRNGILRYEKIFGKTFVSTGGLDTTRELTKNLDLKQNQRVLDVCCGIGGSAFFMAREYGALVNGVDLSTNMLNIAKEYRETMEAEVKHRVQFHMEDVTKMKYPREFYEAIYSRDGIMHIQDKKSLYKNFYDSLVPGGKVLVSDYCCKEGELTEDFKSYMVNRSYFLIPVKDYGQILKDIGFSKVEALDLTDMMIDMLHKELKEFAVIKDEFIADFSKEDYDWIVKGWELKIKRCSPEGEHRWGLIMATK